MSFARDRQAGAHEVSVKFPPCLGFRSDVKDPARPPEVIKTPPPDGDDNVKDDRDEEEICWENELMMEEMGDNSEQDGEE